ncbi:DNA-binding response regulator, OmpR family, contains REC and winged-helix (wHTH) domain [Pseudoxanthomonas sp. GM95]|uniref:response regulator transcription factor n=1 Tax=Pseudoxanthomonas sp. GM95 TaxID=1881043 RepID=UPI0008C64BBD|nr:response regulator transcription factor [Pseudoxanthomonas sp. GM95]SEL94041.1 DNA-binding response regulator, OmpR family, contains REC and winged-helix (wHTH) domain [Pseudoxanthomonas sp. GM95]
MEQTFEEKHLLLVEDDATTAAMLTDYLVSHGYMVDLAADGHEGLKLAGCLHYEVIVVDGQLPRMDGLDLCRAIRESLRKTTPILFLSGRDQVNDRVAGLQAGADDYLVKPFSPLELQARLKALVNRQARRVVSSTMTVADLTLDTQQHVVRRAGRLLSLSPIQFQLLTVLMKASPGIVSRSEIEKIVWGGEMPDTDTLRSHLYTLRKIIDKPFDQPLLHTIVGFGYRLGLMAPFAPVDRTANPHATSAVLA